MACVRRSTATKALLLFPFGVTTSVKHHELFMAFGRHSQDSHGALAVADWLSSLLQSNAGDFHHNVETLSREEGQLILGRRVSEKFPPRIFCPAATVWSSTIRRSCGGMSHSASFKQCHYQLTATTKVFNEPAK